MRVVAIVRDARRGPPPAPSHFFIFIKPRLAVVRPSTSQSGFQQDVPSVVFVRFNTLGRGGKAVWTWYRRVVLDNVV